MGWGLRFLGMALCGLLGCARSAAGLAMDVDSAQPGDASTADGGDTPNPPDGGTKDADPGPLPMSDAGGGNDDAGAPDAGNLPMCQATNMCASARNLTSVAGDTDSDTSMTTGMRSEWLNVTVTDTTLTGSSLAANITLTSSGGSNYDLFVLKPNDDGGSTSAPKDCGATPTGSQNANGTDTVSLTWDDETNNLGESAGDGLVLSIEVRHVSGPCGSWSLLVQGNP